MSQSVEAQDHTQDIERTINNIQACYIEDTTQINRTYRQAIVNAPNSAMELNAINQAENEYSNLVKEYYKLLFKNLNREEKILIMNDQRKWKQFINTERSIYSNFSKPPYVMNHESKDRYVFFAKRYLSQTQDRLGSLYTFLQHIYLRNHKNNLVIDKVCVSPL
ncbi:hypothetical protein K4L44_01220 [Halosquirtibacter laminarini]|uniref:Uncharacterized protein n=1 Tax=Halosquirtibacter laminarini TaxID=3374600 RepID=A0AC61NJS6_9BACT|nr:hypothetical protein K4L44_01220 [Prolixibacteraceae bacterium]